jgi:naphthoate synthase
MWYRNPKIKAREALDIGLINQVVPDDELTDATLEYAMEIAERGAFALASIKAAFNARHGGVGGLSRMAHDLLLRGYLTTQESKELSSAFAERRSPDSDTFGH